MLYYQHLSNYHPKHFQMTISSGEGLCLLRPMQLVMYCGHRREKKKKYLKINYSYKTLILPGLLCFTYINSGNLLLIEVGLLASTNNEHINLNSAFPLTVRKSEYLLTVAFGDMYYLFPLPPPVPYSMQAYPCRLALVIYLQFNFTFSFTFHFGGTFLDGKIVNGMSISK